METLAFINDLLERNIIKSTTCKESNLQNLAIIRTEIYKYGILSLYLEDSRMIFYTSKQSRFSKWKETSQNNIKQSKKDTRKCENIDMNICMDTEMDLDNDISSEEFIHKVNNKLWLECNGLQLDCSDLNNITFLVIPQVSFISHYNTNLVNKYINKSLYNIYKIEDGTIINIYYYNKNQSWVISTTRGIDVSIYNDILIDILKEKDINIDEFYKSLDKNNCYTFNIQHNSIHKFNNANNIWFIQSINLTNMNVSNIEFIKIPNQVLLPYKQEDTVSILNIINKTNKYSLNNYLNTDENNLGYILKSNNVSLTGISSNIIIESSLMKKIRQLLYSNKYVKLSKKYNVSTSEIVVVSSYLDVNNNNLFIKLFPCYTNTYNILAKITLLEISNIIRYSKSVNNTKNTEIFSTVTKFLFDNINKLYNLNSVNDIHLQDIIHNFLINENNLCIYLNLVKNN